MSKSKNKSVPSERQIQIYSVKNIEHYLKERGYTTRSYNIKLEHNDEDEDIEASGEVVSSNDIFFDNQAFAEFHLSDDKDGKTQIKFNPLFCPNADLHKLKSRKSIRKEYLETVVQVSKEIHALSTLWQKFLNILEEYIRLEREEPSCNNTEMVKKKADEYISLGVDLGNQGKYDEAIQHFEAAIRIDPGNAIAWNNKAYILNLQQKYQEAWECCDKSIRLDPNLDHAWCTMAEILFNMDKADKAITCVDKAIAISPHDPNFKALKGRMLCDLNNFEKALECFNENVNANPDDTFSWFEKARIEDQMGQIEAALSSYQRFLSLVPEDYKEHITHAETRIEILHSL